VSEEIFKLIKSDIDERRQWEDRQATAYKLRHGQVKRRTKPFKSASDFGWPLVDMFVEKHKPAYVEQVFGPEKICSFFSKNAQGQGFTTAVAEWFDYRVKHKSDFPRAIQHAIDYHLVGGKAFVKTFWDCDLNCVRDQMIPGPLFVVPPWTEQIDDGFTKADRACHIIHLSTLTYKRIGGGLGYNLDDDFIKSISGKGEEKMYELARELKEGISYHKKEDMIVLWEVYERLPSGKLKVHTLSPMHPEEQIRDDFMFPYDHGRIPVVAYDFEITDPGFYSPRGLGEICALPQSILKMLIDMEFDYLQFVNRPIFKPGPNNPAVNYENLELIPGQVINVDLVPITWPAPPMDFTEKQEKIRSIWEQRIATPDYGIGDQEAAGQGRKTATEVSQLGAVKESGVNLHARVFGSSLSETLKMHWKLELQYNKKDLNYFYQREYKTLDSGALQDIYELEPNGGKDGYSREKQLQKLVQIWQMFQGSPNINFGELCKRILENVDPQLVKAIFIPTNQSQNDQMLKQAEEIGAMKLGFNPVPDPTDNHLAHIQTIEVFKQYAKSNPEASVGPDVQLRVMQHEDAHIETLKKQSPPQYRANKAMLDKIEHDNKALGHAIAHAVQVALAHMNGQAQQQMPGQAAGGAPGPQPGVSPVPPPTAPNAPQAIPGGPQAGSVPQSQPMRPPQM
jgi:hypothetical protein